jgi:glycosyltransferase involved in cell wall biosynthesis
VRPDFDPIHVVIVDEELPYPATSGKRIRTLNLTLRLARRHRITYLCHRNTDADEARRAAAYFGEIGIKTVVVDRVVPPKSGPAFYARLGANLLSPLPYSVATHASHALRAAIDAYSAEHQVDLWHCEWTPYFESLRHLSGARRLIMAHNIESQIWRRYEETESNPAKRWYIRQQRRKFERFERQAFAEADEVVTVSDPDAELARRAFAARRVSVVDNGVDTVYFAPQPEVPRDPNTILFLGSLDWRPNLDAVRVLLERIFPAVRAEEPSARLVLVGRNPPDWLAAAVHETRAVELHASVPDVRPFLARSGVLVVPLRIGGGSRLKILEALAAGVPVVSTAVGAEGLHLGPGRDLVVVNGMEDMAPALVAALRDPGAMRAMAEHGHRRVLERYDWDVLADRLEQVWLDLAGRRAGRMEALTV